MSDDEYFVEESKTDKKLKQKVTKEKPKKEKAEKISGVVKHQVNPKKLKEYFSHPRGYKVSAGALTRCLDSMRDYCRRLVEDSFEKEREQIAVPVVFFAPSASTFDISPFRAKVGKDGKIRYTNYCVTAFYFFRKTFLRYTCDFSLVYNIVENECAEEVFYSDIISMGLYTDTYDIAEKAEIKKYKVKLFMLGTASRHIEIVLRNLTAEKECDFIADDKDILKKVNRIKYIITGQKYVNHAVSDNSDIFNGQETIPVDTDY